MRRVEWFVEVESPNRSLSASGVACPTVVVLVRSAVRGQGGDVRSVDGMETVWSRSTTVETLECGVCGVWRVWSRVDVSWMVMYAN